MPYRVTLTFVVDDEDLAWELAEGLEQTAIRKNYRESNSYVTAEGRAEVLGPEDAPIRSSAETLERQELDGSTGIGVSDGEMITLGGEHGESG